MSDPSTRGQRLLAAGISERPAATTWQPPTVAELAGVFPNLEVQRLIGQGGMGAVYQARQSRLERTVALKLLRQQSAESGDAFARRFQREGRILARLRHPHIVALYDLGEAQGWQYLVMEYIEGATLRQAMATGPFTVGAALSLMPQLLDALILAHAQGIIHRDLKPENILIDERGQARIADFGLAKLQVGERDANITGTGEVLGTAAYMAPEQLVGAKEIDHRADIYALGVVLYEMLTGRLPVGSFEKPSRRVRSDGRTEVVIDERLDAVVMRMLERRPEQRWASAAELRLALETLLPRVLPALPAWQRPSMWALCAAMILLGLAAGQLMVMARDARAHGVAPASGAAANGVAAGGAGPAPAAVPPPAPATSPAPAAALAVPASAPAAVPTAVPAAAILATPTPSPPPAPAAAAGPVPTPAAAAAAAAATSPPPAVATSAATAPVPSPAASAASAAPAVPPPPAAPPGEAAAGAAPALDDQALVVSGPGQLDITIDPNLPAGAALADRLPEGLEVDAHGAAPVSAGGARPLALIAHAAHLRLAVATQGLHWLRYTGSGALALSGLHGQGLVIEHLGTGTLTVSGLELGQLEVRHGSVNVTRLSGHVDHLQLEVTPPPHRPSGDSGASGQDGPQDQPTGRARLDASDLQAVSIDANVDGGATLQLAGSCANLVLHLGSGAVEAVQLAVGHADVTIDGPGHATLGPLKALDVTCIGPGSLRYQGDPVIGRQQLRP